MGQSVHVAWQACTPGMATYVTSFSLGGHRLTLISLLISVLPPDPPQPLVQRETLVSGRLPGPVHGSVVQVKEMLRQVADFFRPDSHDIKTRQYDIITRAQLPYKLDESKVRTCTRCGSSSMISPLRAVQEGGEDGFWVFETAFRRRCICGGLWSRLQS
jgi:Mediator complex subunit 16